MTRTPEGALDHILVGAPTLESGIDWLEERTGVRASPGGSHPGLGTWNALASLGPAQYIEIIAPDPAQTDLETFYVPGLRGFGEPRVATWAASGLALASRFLATLPPDLSCAPARQGTRFRPDGTRLAWRLAFPRHRDFGAFDGALPFFIEWETAAANHPGATTPAGSSLRSLSLRHPEPEALRSTLLALGIEGEVAASANASINVVLDTPRGLVDL